MLAQFEKNLSQINREEVNLADFSQPDQICKKYPGITGPMLRWWLYNRDTNGLDVAVKKIGKRLLINEVELARWINAHSER
jgi:hypothetical protein